MKKTGVYLEEEAGYALTMVTVLALLSSMIAGTYMATTSNESKHAQHQVDSTEALYLAESGLQRGMYELRTRVEDPNLSLPTAPLIIQDYSTNSIGPSSTVNYLGNYKMDIYLEPNIPDIAFNASVSASVGSASKTIRAVIRRYPPAGVFDYVYFVNNWGWFYGNGIRANGDVRSNGRFDFVDNPTVNGEVYAVEDITMTNGGIQGQAGTQGPNGGYPYQHSNSSYIPMPELHDLTFYENLAIGLNASISVGGTVLVDGVYGDDVGESGNIVLVGTTQNPIEINGPNVIRGDVVIKGIVTGKGSLYSGRNIYIADNVSYNNGPTQARPASNSGSDKDAYAAQQNRDLIAYVARENIIIGDYTSQKGGGWSADTWLFTMGNEDGGLDGIPGTGDLYEGDGIFQPDYEDVDKDGVQDDNYNWSDVVTTVPITQFDNVPVDISDFGDIASNALNSLDGIFFTNHAIAGKLGPGGASWNGALIARDESMVHATSLNFNYDERIHSRYTGSDFFWLFKMGLPIVNDWKIEEWTE